MEDLSDGLKEIDQGVSTGEHSIPNLEGLDELQKELMALTKLVLPHDTELIKKVENLKGTTPKKVVPIEEQAKQTQSAKSSSSGKGKKSQR